jgi:DNA polymerase
MHATSDALRALLRWYAEMGVDDVVGEAPANWATGNGQRRTEEPAAPIVRSPSPKTAPAVVVRAPAVAADEAIRLAEAAAAQCLDHAALAAAVARFDACPLRAGARMTVFADGVPGSDLLVIGEAPGRDEDACGKPFVGRAGQLLDKMLAAIGRSRAKNALITNVVFWRPPGNREPTHIEIAICRPFVERLIELTAPKAILLAGTAPTKALLGLAGVTRARGAFRDLVTASGARFPAMPVFHPAFLLRQPDQKRLAWRDLLALEKRLTAD